MKVIIIGGVAGGASAAARIRRLDESAEITIFERTGFISYANCGLPYYVGGEIKDKAKLTLQTPQSFWKRFRINVKVRHEVTAIDTAAKTVTVCNLEKGESFTEGYDKLILSPGAAPIKPPIPGLDSSRVFTLRTVEDCYRISDHIDASAPASALVVGGGFVGVEMCENLKAKGMEVTLVDAADQVLGQFDYDMACRIHAELRKNGVKLLLGTKIMAFEEDDAGITAVTDGDKLRADIVIMSVGVKPDTPLAVAAGIETGMGGAIKVDENMRTSAPDVYAVGDAVITPNFITGGEALNSLASPANKQGRIVADCVCGLGSKYRGSIATSIVKAFDMAAASCGLNEKAARALGLDYEKVVITAASHAGYYPGGSSMVIKVLFAKADGKLLGAQITGYDGVDKRMDVIATAIRFGGSICDLTELDLSYAPPFSSAKDPVNMVGFVGENVLTGKVSQFHWEDLADLPRDGSVTLLDVRTEQEYAGGNIEGFMNIPLDSLLERIDEVPKGKKVYVNCQSALRSYIACRILSQLGYECSNFSGGYGFYKLIAENAPLPKYGLTPCGMVKE